MARRPNLAPRIEKNLALRNGNACAYPGCGDELIIEPAHPMDESKVVGKVAHIAAASPGGPRYDPEMTEAQRSSIENLIFLCGPHHDAIDSQLNFHTREYLLDAKRTHEALVRRSVRTALGLIGFDELEAVCSSLAGVAAPTTTVQIPLDVNGKIELNGLGDDARASISDGMALVGTVGAYIDAMQSINPGLGERLAAQFKTIYYAAVAEHLDADTIFDQLVWTAMEHHGATVNARRQAAALAVVVYLFERCEVFESAPSPAK